MTIEAVRELCHDETIVITKHSLKRLIERGIELARVKQAIMHGEIIEDYPEDYPYPSCLILGMAERLHVCAGVGDGCLWLITAYEPDPAKWETDLRTRKKGA